MKKLLGCLALAAALVPSAALAEDSRLRPGVFADTYCELRWSGFGHDRALEEAVELALVFDEKPTMVTRNGERVERGVALAAEWVDDLCPNTFQ